MVDCKRCGLASLLSDDIGWSIYEKFRGVGANLDDLVAMSCFFVGVGDNFFAFLAKYRRCDQMTKNH